jgi:hypothetical protein
MRGQQRKKSLCEVTGHAWEPTTAPNFRRCSRSSCKAAQHLRASRWVDVPTNHSKQQGIGESAAVALWSEREVSA